MPVSILSSTTYISQTSGQCCILGMKAKVWEYHLPSHRISHGTHTLRRMHHTPALLAGVFSPLTQQSSDLSPLPLARISRSCKHSCRVLVLSVCSMRWHGLAQAFRTTRWGAYISPLRSLSADCLRAWWLSNDDGRIPTFCILALTRICLTRICAWCFQTLPLRNVRRGARPRLPTATSDWPPWTLGKTSVRVIAEVGNGRQVQVQR